VRGCEGVVHNIASDKGFEHLSVCDVLGGNLERIAVEYDEISELADLERPIASSGEAHRPRRSSLPGARPHATSRIVAEAAAILGRRIGRVGAGQTHLESKPFIQPVDRPVAAKSDAGAGCGQEPGGLQNFHALWPK